MKVEMKKIQVITDTFMTNSQQQIMSSMDKVQKVTDDFKEYADS